jgi:signal transduction histidine kinase
LRRADGALREIEIMLAPLPDHGHAVEQMVIDDVTDQRRATAELERSGRTLRRLQASVVEAREEERRRIARELHDELGQRLTALKMDLSALAATPAATGTAQGAAASVPAMLAMLDETVAAVRRIASDLRPLMLDDLGLTAAIEWLARDLARRTGIEVAVQQQDLRDPPAEPLATALYRMVQEGLTNAVRHAKATRVEVALQEQGDAIVLTVSDNGVGLPEASAVRDDAFGLLGLRERAAMLGGTLTLEGHAAPGGGARLTVFLPLKRRNTGAKS